MISDTPNSAFDLDDVKDSLFQSLENLYSVFSTYPLKPVVEGCPHCIGKKMESHLHRVPLRELTAEDLENYSFKAMTTWGDSADYRHFLPRIVELSLNEDRCLGFEPWLIGSKLNHANWTSWPLPERESINQFLLNAWRVVLAFSPEVSSGTSTGPVQWAVNDSLSLQANAREDISSILEIWSSSNELEPQLHLALFARDTSSYFAKKRKLEIATTIKNSLALEQLINWIMNPSLLSKLKNTFEDELDEPWADMLAEGIDGLEWIQQVGAAR